jgi:hypothetical protein
MADATSRSFESVAAVVTTYKASQVAVLMWRGREPGRTWLSRKPSGWAEDRAAS